MAKSVTDIQKLCRENDIKMIDFKMVDLEGRWRHLAIPVARFTEDTMKYGIGFDGSNYGYAQVEKSDMVFIPDLESAHIDPFVDVKTMTMMGRVRVIGKDENKPFDQYPPNVAQAAVDYMKAQGIADRMLIGPEFEFYLLDSVSYEVKPERVGFTLDSQQAEWNSCYDGSGYTVPNKKGYHCALPQDITNSLRSRMCVTMGEWGIDVKYHHHEVGGPGQLEIEVELEDMVPMADKTMIIKYVIKNEAVKEGKTATFMPKPLFGVAGSGMHVHMLLLKDGQPVFYDENGYSGLSQTALYFMGGLLKHCPSLCGLTNPSTNSYKRLIPGFEAPVTIGYATSNRSAVIRIPAYAKSPMTKRFELRNPDATCNPYFAYAAILMAGLDGIRNQIDPSANGWGPFDFNLFNLSPEEQAKIQGLPHTLEEALDALEADHDYLTAGGVFPEKLLEIWIAKRRAEAAEISKIPHPAEFAKYYDL